MVPPFIHRGGRPFFGPSRIARRMTNAGGGGVNLASGLEAHFEFSEGTAFAVADSSGNSRNGTADAGFTWPTGHNSDFAGLFNGSCWITMPDFTLTYPISISCWVKDTGQGYIVCLGDSGSSNYCSIYKQSDGRYATWTYAGSYNTGARSAVATAGVWQHVVAVWESASKRTIYLNKTPVENLTAMGSVSLNKHRIGALETLGFTKYNPCSGNIDDVRIYSRVLTQDDVDALYDLTNAVPVASSVTFSGTLSSGSTLTGSYAYSDEEGEAEGTSTYQWYRADDASGTNAAAIAGATGSTYVLQVADEGYHIAFGVVPVAAAGATPGSEVISSYSSTAVVNPAFISTWETTTASESITIPTTGAGYSGNVDWGDGNSDAFSGTAPTISHTYAVAGTYTVKITGTFPRIYCSSGGFSRTKLRTVTNWGTVGWTSMNGALDGASGLTAVAANGPNVADWTIAFRNCSALTTATGLLTGVTNGTTFANTFESCGLTSTLDMSDTAAINLGNAYKNCDSITTVTAAHFAGLSTVTNISTMFDNCGALTTIESGAFDGFTGVTTAQYTFRNTLLASVPANLFAHCSSLTDLSGFFELTRVTSTVDISATAATVILNLYKQCDLLTTVTASHFNKSTVQNCQGLFYDCDALTSVPATLFSSFGATCTNYYQAFYGTGALTSVPSTLFSGCSAATNLQECFELSGLTSIPTGFLDSCISLQNAQSIFRHCPITAIPAELFRYAGTSLTNVTNAFANCTALTTIGTDLFRYNTAITGFQNTFGFCSNLASVPSSLFQYNVNATSFYQTFKSCTSLTTFNAALFQYNTAVTIFQECFENAGISTIPAGAFQYNTSATNFQSAFRYCTGITSVPANLLDTQAFLNVNWLFDGCSSLTSCDFGTWNWTACLFARGVFGEAVGSDPTINTTDYNASWVGIDAQTLQSGVRFDAINSVATGAGLTARNNVVTGDSWTVNDAS